MNKNKPTLLKISIPISLEAEEAVGEVGVQVGV